MSNVADFEYHIAGLKEQIELRDAAIRLNQNPDFRKVILQNFCVTECARNAQNSAHPQFTAEQRSDSLALAQSAGHLRRYMSVTVQQGNVAASTLAEAEEQLDEARASEVH